MKKVLLVLSLAVLWSCSGDDDKKECPNGKIKGHNTVQDRNYITLDNGQEITINAGDFDKYPINSCYEGKK